MVTTTTVTKKQVRSAGIASLAGWAMDIYDLTIILYVAPVVGMLLFPAESPMLQLAFVYASFAVTLLFRPLGSLIFGIYADRHGRKRAMLIAILGVGLATALMGAVPVYATAGFLAPVLFILLRIVQGIFVGGVVASTHTLGTETVSPEHRGLMSGFIVGGGSGAGAVLASLMFLAVSTMFPGDAFNEWGWRVMFFTGLLTTALSFYVYRNTEESPLWAGKTEGPKKSPLRVIFGEQYRRFTFLAIAVCAGGATLYYLTMGFLPTYFATVLGIERSTSAIILLATNLAFIVGGFIGGRMSDRHGRRAVFLGFGIPAVVLLPGLYFSLGLTQESALMSLIAVLMGLLVSIISAPLLIFLNELFPTEVRATGTSFVWNIGYAIGGMTPTVITALSPTVDDMPIRLFTALAVAAFVLVVAAALVGETKHRGLASSADHAAGAPHEKPVAAATPTI